MNRFNFFIVSCVVLLLGGFFFYRLQLALAKPISQPLVELNYDLAQYVAYSPATLLAAKNRGQSLLFFAATTWCQSCSELDKEIIARVSEIPKDTTILKVDYDHDIQMNSTYGVTVQHTLLLLDSEGNEVRRWVGGDFNSMLQELQKV